LQDLLSQPTWSDLDGPPKDRLDYVGGVGLRPLISTCVLRNAVAFQFTVYPAGIALEGDVEFDVTREIDGQRWEQLSPGGAFTTKPGTVFFYEQQNEWPRDDRNDGDESEVATQSNHFYSMDSPGIGVGLTSYGEIWRYNFREWVRVRFDGTRPSGNQVSGSRCSAKNEWCVVHTLENVNGIWRRTTGDQQETDDNQIREGRIDIF
jgi:hypothetical protein